MNDFLISMALSVLFQVLKVVIKNPSTKTELEAVFVKLHGAIEAAYPEKFNSLP